MSVVSAKTMPYGPGRLDFQFEQGADFTLAMTVYDPAQQVLNPRGAWSSTATYRTGDAVFYNNLLYIALVNAAANVGQQPDTATAFWAAATPWDLTAATLDAHMQLLPPAPQERQNFTATITNAALGQILLSFPATSSIAITPISAPFRSVDKPPLIGSWLMNIAQGGGTVQVLFGDIYLKRDPCLT